jgi:hypothetical protein
MYFAVFRIQNISFFATPKLAFLPLSFHLFSTSFYKEKDSTVLAKFFFKPPETAGWTW